MLLRYLSHLLCITKTRGTMFSLCDHDWGPYSCLQCIFHSSAPAVEESDIIDLEKRYWLLKAQSRTGRFDLETFAPLVSPPIHASLSEGNEICIGLEFERGKLPSWQTFPMFTLTGLGSTPTGRQAPHTVDMRGIFIKIIFFFNLNPQDIQVVTVSFKKKKKCCTAKMWHTVLFYWEREYFILFKNGTKMLSHYSLSYT